MMSKEIMRSLSVIKVFYVVNGRRTLVSGMVGKIIKLYICPIK